MFELDQDALNAALAEMVAPDLLRRGLQVANTAKRLTRGPGHGRLYLRHGIGHVAAAPGEPFASDTGRLSNSITAEVQVHAEGPVCFVGSDVEYAIFQELGTSRMPAHPFLRPALGAAAGGGE
jgi:HK97 gp10 family phage protein